MSLDSIVLALKSCFKTKHQKGFFYSADSSLCRVCTTVCDRDHSNNLFSERNCGLLAVAETLHRKSLPRGDFPHLVCRPCSRRLNNTKLLRTRPQLCAIHRINHYPLDSAIGFANSYPLDSDLSGG